MDREKQGRRIVKRILNRYLVAAVLLGLGIYAAAWYFKPAAIPPGVTLDAKAAPAVSREKTAPVAVGKVQAYAPAAKKKLKLPATVQLDSAKHVVASSLTVNDERRHTVTTVLDTGTGEFSSYDRAEPLPWVSVNTKSQVGVFYGIKGGAPVLRLQAQQEFLQIKAVRLGAVGTLDGDAAYFVGVGAWARW